MANQAKNITVRMSYVIDSKFSQELLVTNTNNETSSFKIELNGKENIVTYRIFEIIWVWFNSQLK